MFDSCQHGSGGGDMDGTATGTAARCAEKLASLFAWRHTYKVEKFQRSLSNPPAKRRPVNQARRKTGDSWLVVHSLQSRSDGGILDPDDRLHDVADDREQIIANYEDADTAAAGPGGHGPRTGGPTVGHHGGGDGASGSSVGTGSPDIFQQEQRDAAYRTGTDIEVTGELIASALTVLTPLQVRRGSESALNQLVGSNAAAGSRVSSAAPGVWSNQEPGESKRLYKKEPSRNGGGPPESWRLKEPEDSRFSRAGSNRLSMQFLGDGSGLKWAEAADNLSNRASSKSLPRRRKEPLGRANSASPTQPRLIDEEDDPTTESYERVVVSNESGPLGIHVVPDYDRLGNDRGLLVQGIEPGGRIDRDGRLAVFDRIVEINGSDLINMPFHRVQEVFKAALRSPELRLRVVKHRPGSASTGGRRPPAPVYPRSEAEEKENGDMVEGEERTVKVATVSPTRKTISSNKPTGTSLLSANTRKIGRKIALDLVKGPQGLGFSVTTRDNPAGGNCPIYIKNILTKGAAVEDGRLRPGDRLLEVNGVEMTGKTQDEAVALLREAPMGQPLRLVVSRQEEAHSPKMPRVMTEDADSREHKSPTTNGDSKMKPSSEGDVRNAADKSSEDTLSLPWKHREILTFDIPVHDTEKAGLGVSVKGKTSSAGIDLGIFVKSVLHGGAASRDRRLRTNDQLLDVNGASLVNQSNADAMETLRRAMLATEGPLPGKIAITVARRATPPGQGVTSPEGFLKEEPAPCTPDNSGTSENSDNTVIFLPCRTGEDRKQSYELISPARHPVLERLTGRVAPSLRNESYYRATTAAGDTSCLLRGADMVLIEEDVAPPQQQQPARQQAPSDATYTSQLSLEEAAAGFSRDAFGRQSMSEKRHATLDAKHTDTYQRNKKIREERDKFKHDPQHSQPHDAEERPHRHQFGPALGMKKSSSLESLQTLVHEMRTEGQRHGDNSSRAVRGRGCNESFRAAVDRSYEAPQDQDMDANDWMESGFSGRNSARQSSMNAAYDKHKGGKKKPGLLRGIGSMFRFHRQRKTTEVVEGWRGAEEQEAARRAAQEEQRRIQEQYRRLISRQAQAESEGFPPSAHHRENSVSSNHTGPLHNGPMPAPYSGPPGPYKGPPNMPPPVSYNGPNVGHQNGHIAQHSNVNIVSNVHQNGPNVHQNGPNVHQNGPNMHQNGPNVHQNGPNVHQNGPNLHQNGPNVHQNGPNVNHQNGPNVHHNGPTQGPMGHRREGSNTSTSIHIGSTHGYVNQRETSERRERINSNQDVISRNREGSTSSTSSLKQAPAPAVPAQASQAAQSRSERIHQLRAQHQRRHVERRSVYPLEEAEEQHERDIRERLESDVYGEICRPGSRVGITDHRYSHYVNYEEIQMHLNKRREHLSDSQIMQMRLQVQHQRFKVEEESRRQQHYHSQRREPRPQQRPVSNFYEYESVQAILRQQQEEDEGVVRCQDDQPVRGSVQALARRFQDKAINGHEKMIEVKRSPGPFVTQVMIGQSQPPGSKV